VLQTRWPSINAVMCKLLQPSEPRSKPLLRAIDQSRCHSLTDAAVTEFISWSVTPTWRKRLMRFRATSNRRSYRVVRGWGQMYNNWDWEWQSLTSCASTTLTWCISYSSRMARSCRCGMDERGVRAACGPPTSFRPACPPPPKPNPSQKPPAGPHSRTPLSHLCHTSHSLTCRSSLSQKHLLVSWASPQWE
jgi:hypothetical protein